MGVPKGTPNINPIGKAMSELIIRNATLISSLEHVFQNAFIHIKDDQIHAIGSMTNLSTTINIPSIDVNHAYVMPGWINMHMHFYSALARGISVGPMTNFQEILSQLWWKLDNALTLDDIYLSAMVFGIEAIRAGVTTLFDHHASFNAIEGSLSTIGTAISDLGLRASLCYEISDRHGEKKSNAAIKENHSWLEQSHTHPLMSGLIGLHASMTLSDQTLARVHELISYHQCGIHVHIAEGVEDIQHATDIHQSTPVKRFHRYNLLNSKSLGIHAVHVDHSDIQILKDTQCNIVHNPLSNCNNAVGIAPMLSLYNNDIPTMIGTDAMSAGLSHDIKAAAVIHKLSANDPQAGWDMIANSAMTHAARFTSTHFNSKIGEIKPGFAADLIVLEHVPATPINNNNIWGHILFDAINAPVKSTMVAGKWLMKDYALCVDIDEHDIYQTASEHAKKLWQRMNEQ